MRDIGREQLLKELLALKPVFEREGVIRMALFGSRARQDNRADSDVDLIIEVQEGRKFSGLDLAGVWRIIVDNTGLESSLVLRKGLDDDPAFRARVEQDQISVF